MKFKISGESSSNNMANEASTSGENLKAGEYFNFPFDTPK